MSRESDIMSYMAIITIEQLKAKFESGDSPRSSDYMNMIDTLASLPEFPLGAGTGSVTSITAGTGLTGGAITSSGTINVDTTVVQTRVSDVSDTEIGYLNGVTSSIQTQINAKSPLESPTFTGTPSAPTATQGNNTTQIATTAYVDTAVSNIIDAAPTTLNTLNEIAAALGDDANYATTITTALGNKQAIVSGVSDTEIGYLDGVTSGIQTQLNTKASTGKAIAMAIVFGG
jgi:hypothetical protein